MRADATGIERLWIWTRAGTRWVPALAGAEENESARRQARRPAVSVGPLALDLALDEGLGTIDGERQAFLGEDRHQVLAEVVAVFGADFDRGILAIENLRCHIEGADEEFVGVHCLGLDNRQAPEKRLRAGLPSDWQVGDKTGTWDGTSNDIAIIRPPGRQPILAAVYLTEAKVDTAARDNAIADVGRIIAELYR